MLVIFFLLTSNVLKAAEPLPALWAVVGVFFALLKTGVAAQFATAE